MLTSEPFQVEDESDRPSRYRLPFVHLDPGLTGFLDGIARSDHHPLELLGILPFLQLHGTKPAADEAIQFTKDLLELLNTEIGCPARQEFIEIRNDLIHR